MYLGVCEKCEKKYRCSLIIFSSAVLEQPQQDDVYHLTAIDRDSDLFNKIRFTVTSSIFPSRGRNLPIDGAFFVNPETGMIRVGRPAYTAFTDGYFLLDVKAEDQSDASKTSATQIKVKLDSSKTSAT